jgi:cytochrome c peroxidase
MGRKSLGGFTRFLLPWGQCQRPRVDVNIKEEIVKRLWWGLPVAAMVFAMAACGDDGPNSTAPTPQFGTGTEGAAVEIDRARLVAFSQLPAEVTPSAYEMTEELVDLGRMLYYEHRMSISQELSCNSCHLLDQWGVDGVQFSLGHEGIPVGRNSPTVYNAALHVAQFWDGRSPDVEDQAKGPILAAGEMGMPDPEYVMFVLRTIPGYVDMFDRVFPGDEEPMNYDNVAQAIGAFERRLTTPDRFDQFLGGDDEALTNQEKAGLNLFLDLGCSSCHYGPALGGESYSRIGVVKEYPGVTDVGRFEVTGRDTDRYAFKVPSLRNILETGPYLHDGSIATIEEMIKVMAEYQLGKNLTDQEVANMVAFFGALTGDLPLDYIAKPELPASGPDTPGPYEYND